MEVAASEVITANPYIHVHLPCLSLSYVRSPTTLPRANQHCFFGLFVSLFLLYVRQGVWLLRERHPAHQTWSGSCVPCRAACCSGVVSSYNGERGRMRRKQRPLMKTARRRQEIHPSTTLLTSSWNVRMYLDTGRSFSFSLVQFLSSLSFPVFFFC